MLGFRSTHFDAKFGASLFGVGPEKIVVGPKSLEQRSLWNGDLTVVVKECSSDHTSMNVDVIVKAVSNECSTCSRTSNEKSNNNLVGVAV